MRIFDEKIGVEWTRDTVRVLRTILEEDIILDVWRNDSGRFESGDKIKESDLPPEK